MARLNSAFFPDFKTGPKVLLWGNRAAVTSLVEFLRNSRSDGVLDFVHAVDGRVLSVESGARSQGMQVDDERLTWKLSADGMAQFADLLDPLIESSKPCHQYLRCGDEPIEVMVSVDEYPADLRP